MRYLETHRRVAFLLVLTGGLVTGLYTRAWAGPDALHLLQTPWPKVIDCPRFSAIKIRVEESIGRVEWRGRDPGDRLAIPVTRPALPDAAYTSLQKLSPSVECGDEAGSCVLYPARVFPATSFRAAVADVPVSDSALLGRLTTLALFAVDDWGELVEDTRHLKKEFGLLLLLACAEPGHASVEWRCDGKSCELWSTDPTARLSQRGLAYQENWKAGPGRRALGRLVAMRAPALHQRAADLNRLTRDLLTEMGVVLDESCPSRCSARVARLRATVHALLRHQGLTLGRITDESDGGGMLGLIAPSRGWHVQLLGKGGEVELACAHQRSKVPVEMNHSWFDDCRIQVRTGHRVLAHYFPDKGKGIELSDGGAIHPEPGIGTVLIGSAIARTPEGDP